MPKPGIVICVSGGVVQAVYAADADSEVILIDWDADLEDADLSNVVVVNHSHCRRAAFVGRLHSEPLANLSGSEAEFAIKAAEAKGC